jgi:hypothetical protein
MSEAHQGCEQSSLTLHYVTRNAIRASYLVTIDGKVIIFLNTYNTQKEGLGARKATEGGVKEGFSSKTIMMCNKYIFLIVSREVMENLGIQNSL